MWSPTTEEQETALIDKFNFLLPPGETVRTDLWEQTRSGVMLFGLGVWAYISKTGECEGKVRSGSQPKKTFKKEDRKTGLTQAKFVYRL